MALVITNGGFAGDEMGINVIFQYTAFCFVHKTGAIGCKQYSSGWCVWAVSVEGLGPRTNPTQTAC
jgi:hypothetical protein